MVAAPDSGDVSDIDPDAPRALMVPPPVITMEFELLAAISIVPLVAVAFMLP